MGYWPKCANFTLASNQICTTDDKKSRGQRNRSSPSWQQEDCSITGRLKANQRNKFPTTLAKSTIIRICKEGLDEQNSADTAQDQLYTTHRTQFLKHVNLDQSKFWWLNLSNFSQVSDQNSKPDVHGQNFFAMATWPQTVAFYIGPFSTPHKCRPIEARCRLRPPSAERKPNTSVSCDVRNGYTLSFSFSIA